MVIDTFKFPFCRCLWTLTERLRTTGRHMFSKGYDQELRGGKKVSKNIFLEWFNSARGWHYMTVWCAFSFGTYSHLVLLAMNFPWFTFSRLHCYISMLIPLFSFFSSFSSYLYIFSPSIFSSIVSSVN